MNKDNTADEINRLLHRRQFLLAPIEYHPNKFWTSTSLNNELYLSVHTDLPYVSKIFNSITLTLIGIAVDSINPGFKESDIVENLLVSASDIYSLINATKPLAGRWVIVFQKSNETYIFTDPCGFRPVYYYSDGKNQICASQPEIIRANYYLNEHNDEALIDFWNDPKRAIKESPWVGSKTIYQNCYHLMPNHFLKLNKAEQIRFFPGNSLKKTNPLQAAETVSFLLKNILNSIVSRHDVIIPLTAGWDSRILLAATKERYKDIDFYVDRMNFFPRNHPEITVPGKIAKRFDIKFNVINSKKKVPKYFMALLSKNITKPRDLKKTRSIYLKYINQETRININGNASEICRLYAGRLSYDRLLNEGDHTIRDGLTKYLGLHNDFVLKEVEMWQNDINKYDLYDGSTIFDMFYWEQKLGNWGSQYPSEQDIVIDEFSPFNCRLIIEHLLSTPRDLRSGPDFNLYNQIIQNLWPELLDFPFNPKPKVTVISKMIDSIKPFFPKESVKKLINYLR